MDTQQTKTFYTQILADRSYRLDPRRAASLTITHKISTTHKSHEKV
jgi:hypothetical protein